ncbi:AI-2E family transporter [Candidatus Methylospira mobilis]|uniref:AI-2E family transporter n=1 Tax=Candidatus Methylospira mobilis TaxID=1808979 RepID=UPI0018854F25|nr:AI-2E family transporter [Candidatus Methylospira mobilis]
MVLNGNRIDRFIGIAMIAVLIAGCFAVLRPFLSAILWAVILSFSTWPVYQWVVRSVAGGKTVASGLMVLLIAVVMIVPLVLLGTSLADNITALVEMVRHVLSEGLPRPPAWLIRLPVVGVHMYGQWQAMEGSGVILTEKLMRYLLPLRDWALHSAANLGGGIVYLSLSVFIAFFLYRDGESLSARLEALSARIGGKQALGLMRIAENTIKSVVYGIIGTALAQGFLAGIGFWVAAIPGALLLGVLTSLLSIIPAGPPFIWMPAAIWLLERNETGWAVFIALWGCGVVSGVDNILKPYFISKGSRLPFILVFLGVMGGVIAFGLIGVFLGPTLLAIAFTLLQEWSSGKKIEK